MRKKALIICAVVLSILVSILVITGCAGNAPAPTVTVTVPPVTVTAGAGATATVTTTATVTPASTATPTGVAPKPQIVWKFNSFDAPESHAERSFLLFERLVADYTGGRVKFEHYPGGALGGLWESMEAIIRGDPVPDVISTANLGFIEPALDLAYAPYLVRNDREAIRFWHRPDGIGRQIIGRVWEKLKVKVLWNNMYGWGTIANSKRPVRNANDVQGLKLRVVPTATMADQFANWGAIPSSIAWDEVFPALEKGVVDGVPNSPADIIGGRFQEAGIKYITFNNHLYFANVVIIHKSRWDVLDKELQQAILRAGQEAESFNLGELAKQNEDAIDELRARWGVQFYYPTEKELLGFEEAAKVEALWNKHLAPALNKTFPGENVMGQIKTFITKMRGT